MSRFPIMFIVVGLCATALAACSGDDRAAPPTALDATRLDIAQGSVVGFETEQGAHAWLAIPYAAAPVGDLRWRAPRPAPDFTAQFEALLPGERCPQLTNGLDEAEGLEPGQIVGSEDCLTLDIYAPPNAENLPVMVWIHGGGNVWGRSGAYNGSQLALDQDVVVIAIQYRLGPLGWMAHPTLRADAAMEADAAASFALLDMIAALEWVQDNAEAFGGDTGRVTIFGESAGGHNVAGLMASPLTRGLFHRGIIQSGIVWSRPLDVAENGSDWEQHGAVPTLAALAGADASAAEIRSIDLDALFAAYEDDGVTDMPRMIEDGVVLGEGGILAAASTPGGFADLPLITGTNLEEMKLYKALDPDLVRRFGLLLWPRDADAYEAVAEYPSRFWRALAVDELANRLRASGHPDVWAYRFDWNDGGSFLVTDSGQLFGAAHSMEIPFVFNHFEFYGALDGLLFTDGNAAGREAIATAMGQHWGRFAHQGVPGDDWGRWQQGGALMRFDSPSQSGQQMMVGEENLDGILSALAQDNRLTSEQRCGVAAELTGWNPPDAAQISASISC